MIGTRDILNLLNSAETAAALERQYALTLHRILVELSQGVSRPGAARAAELIARLRELLAELNPARQGKVRAWIREWLEKAYILGDQAGIDGIKRDLERATEDRRSGFGAVLTGFTAVNQTALSAMISQVDATLKNVAAQMESTLGLAVRRTQLVFHQDQAIRESVVSGIIRGSTGRRLSDDIANIILNGGTPAEVQRLRAAGFQPELISLYKRISEGQMVTVGNKTFDVRTYSNLVGRTMLSDTINLATEVRLQQNGVNHVRINNPSRVGKPDVCTIFAGRIFYIGEGQDPLGFPSLRATPRGGPPWHPNCRHHRTAWVASLKSPSEIESALADVRRIPGDYLNHTAAEVNKLVGALDAAALQKIAPNASKPRAA
jgi:hypothetical protein